MENIETLLAAVAQTTGFGDEEPVVSTPSELDLESLASPVVVHPSPAVVVPDLTAAAPVPVSASAVCEKRKRGRPPKGQLTAKPPRIKKVKVEDEDEDVCFICFDGGSLVLCDRKGCPKAYHPACIKRNEAFFKSKAKWNCGWHICSGCRKIPHYMCYTCTYSLCKGCTKDADFVSVRGNMGFCSTCMKTIMMIENKDKATNDSIQVDFDDKLSWEYLFKMYWVILKEKLSFTLSELTQAKSPWKGVAAVTRKPRLNNAVPSSVGAGVPLPHGGTGHFELNKPHEINLVQNDGLRTSLLSNDNHVKKLDNDNGEHGPTYSNETVKQKVADETSIAKTNDKPDVKEVHELCIKKDLDDPCIVKNTNKPGIGKNTNSVEIDKLAVDSTEWASKDLLDFVKHMKNGDTSSLSQFDVQTLLVEYVKRNNLWDPHQKSHILCDQRLKNIFGKPFVDQTEMLTLLEFHFVVKEDAQKNPFFPARAVRSAASNLDADGKINGSPEPVPSNSRKRKTHKKIENREAQLNLNEYAAIDVHNISLIYLRRNLMVTLAENRESFNDKVIGSIARIKISPNDQKPEVHRLVQVIGTSKVAEPCKIGNKTADVMLEVLNLDRREVVSVDSISNEEFTEDECKWLRQSIRCGLVKQFTVDEVKKKASALQSVRVNDWLEAEILRLSHLRDRADGKGIKKELRKNAERLQLLKSPEERQRRISEVPEIHADPTMNPNYESEEDIRSSDHSKKEIRYASYSGKVEHSVEVQDRITEKTNVSASNDLEKHTNQIDIGCSPSGGGNDQAMERSGLETSTAIASIGNSQPADNIETEKLWHFRDPNSKIQGPFSMMQLRKCNSTGLFPHDMRIWTNHEQYDSLLLTDALDGKLYAAPDMSHKASSNSKENGPAGGAVPSEGTNGTTKDAKQTENAGCSNSDCLPDNVARPVKADESCSSGWPRCWDLLKDGNPIADNVQLRDLLPPSKPETRDEPLTDQGQESDELNLSSQNGEKNAAGPTQNPMPSEDELRSQPKDDDRSGQSSEGNLRSLNINLSSTIPEPAPVLTSVSTSLVSSKQPEKTQNQQSVDADIPAHGTSFLELLSPAPRSNNEDLAALETDTKPGCKNLPMSNSGPGWIGASNLGIGGIQLPDVADEWCGYSQTHAARPPIQEWDSASGPPEVTGENADASAPEALHLSHAPPSHTPSNGPNWLAIMNEPIEFVALGEDSVSDLLAEVDAMESRGALPSPTSAIKFAWELLEDCKDDCFSSIEGFSPTPEPRKSDAFSSTSDVHLTSQSSAPCKPNGTSPVDAFDFFRRSSVNSSASSEGETSAAVHSGDPGSEFHHSPAPNQEMVGAGAGAAMAPGLGSDATDPSWGQMPGNINLVTVQGNVNLVLRGPAAQGMANLPWGTNQGPHWANPNSIRSPRNGSQPWDGQRTFGGERFNCPREWGGYQGSDPGFGGGRGRPPWGRQQYSSGGYSRPLPKGQRVCKFYESGRCKKGAFCDYLHP
ncbi:zinc finger CCCH domain-containing protein 19-like isoform X1 [Salvia splendens]|uniref:zinc finger CCCH domain-containing protein 19-like isoform X1 n=1 Tax=Salvia splendens TaxID=180675 RepID=UPI001C272BBA|nr:zinc finger CCCH domain-containing protein 19-like isoform X1 [Salvia splendens]